MQETARPNGRRRGRRRSRKRSRTQRISARHVYYGIAALALGSAGSVVALGQPAAIASAVGAVLLVGVLYLNDRYGFNRSTQSPRTGEPPRRFTAGQQVVLFVLCALNVFLTIYALM